MPKIYKRGAIWHYAFTVAGRRFRQSAETPRRDEAEQVAATHEARERRAALLGQQAEITFSEAVEFYIGQRPDARYIGPLNRRFGKMKVSEITPPMVRKAARDIYPDASPATWNRQVVTPTRAIINLSAEEGACPHFRMKKFKEDGARSRPAGDKAWLAAFQSTARRMGYDRLAALVRLLFETGARIGQACALTWNDIDLSDRRVTLRTRKTGANGPQISERTAWLTAALVADIANIAPRHPRTVFGYANRSSVAKHWNKVIEKGKLPRLTTHEAGRHGFATEMVVRNNVDPATAADRGGWKSKRLMVETYVHGKQGREVIDKVFGGKRNKR